MKKTDYLSALFVGIDIGFRTNVISAIDFDQNCYFHMKPLPNNQDGASRMEEMICGVPDRHHDFNRVVIAMESTSNYGLHIANYLSSSERLAPFSSKVYIVNPKLIKSFHHHRSIPAHDARHAHDLTFMESCDPETVSAVIICKIFAESCHRGTEMFFFAKKLHQPAFHRPAKAGFSHPGCNFSTDFVKAAPI